MLEQQLTKGIFPSPLILESEEGSSVFNMIAHYALCEHQTACGNCTSCKLLASGNHPDFLQVHGNEVGMEHLRKTLYQLHQKPFRASYRILALSKAHETSINIQNALLKALEEPRKGWIILLETPSRHALLPTVLSRCLVYRPATALYSIKLDKEEKKLFEAIEQRTEFESFQGFEKLFKNRDKTRQFFRNAILYASSNQYPGGWRDLAPYLEEGIEALERNLNPKIVWERLWTRTQIR